MCGGCAAGARARGWTHNSPQWVTLLGAYRHDPHGGQRHPSWVDQLHCCLNLSASTRRCQPHHDPPTPGPKFHLGLASRVLPHQGKAQPLTGHSVRWLSTCRHPSQPHSPGQNRDTLPGKNRDTLHSYCWLSMTELIPEVRRVFVYVNRVQRIKQDILGLYARNSQSCMVYTYKIRQHLFAPLHAQYDIHILDNSIGNFTFSNTFSNQSAITDWARGALYIGLGRPVFSVLPDRTPD